VASPNVDLFKIGIDAYNGRDPEAFVARCKPDCEWHPFLSARVEGEAGYRGHEGIRTWFREIDSMFSETHAEVSEIRDLGDRVLGLGTIRARGKESGAGVSSPIGWLIEVRDGKLRRGWAYASHHEALVAAGIED
jgi:ketosteroid isomerase-like protein